MGRSLSTFVNPMCSALAPAKSHVQRTEHCRREGFDSRTLQGQSGSAVRKACESIRVVDIRTRTKIAWPGGPARSVRPVAPRGSTPAVARAHLPRRESRVGHHARRSHRPAATRLRSAHERDAIPITLNLRDINLVQNWSFKDQFGPPSLPQLTGSLVSKLD